MVFAMFSLSKVRVVSVEQVDLARLCVLWSRAISLKNQHGCTPIQGMICFDWHITKGTNLEQIIDILLGNVNDQ